MATKRPMAVATSASEMPVMTEVVLEDCAASEPKAWMMPSTVPKSPIKGALEPKVASVVSPFSSRARSRVR